MLNVKQYNNINNHYLLVRPLLTTIENVSANLFLLPSVTDNLMFLKEN